MSIDRELMDTLTNSRFTESACSSDTTSSYSITKCLWAGTTPYGDIVIAESPVYGKLLFIDNELQSAESDEHIYHEHLVHPILNATANKMNKRVLIVGGGEGATLREVLKWPQNQVKEIVWVDIDNDLVQLSKEYLQYADGVYEDPRCQFHSMDINVYLESNNTPFDVIILDLPDPDVDRLLSGNALDYELYGNRFWTLIKRNLSPNGQVVSHAGPVAPGKDETKWRPGLALINSLADMPNACAYHVNIPSFQSEWGFWMSLPHSDSCRFPKEASVIDGFSQMIAFSWPKHWFI